MKFSSNFQEEIAKLDLQKEYIVEVRELREKRSLDANAYLWLICGDLAVKMGITKEDVYRQAVKQVGAFVIVPIKDEAIDRWREVWESKGLGWVTDSLGSCKKTRGYSNMIAYYGSSSYNTKEMSTLINYLLAEAKEQGIEYVSQDIRKALEEWRE